MSLSRRLWSTKLARPSIQFGLLSLILILLSLNLSAQNLPDREGGFEDCREHWVGTWSTALHQPDLGVPGLSNSGFSHQTLRQIVHTSLGGNRVRVRFSAIGAGPLVIGAAHIGRSGPGGTVEPGSDRRLTFGGTSSIAVPPGAPVLSDAVELDSPSLGDLAISLYVPGDTGPATWHFESRQTTYISGPGNFTASGTMPVESTATAWFWLAGVEVAAPCGTASVVAFGDSLTDGTQSTVDASHRWPDQLARRLLTGPHRREMGVLNEGIAGNRLLHDSLAQNGLARFDRDVLAQTGATHVIVLIGTGDITNPQDEVSAEQIIRGHQQLIQRAHAKHLKIYGGTLTPFEGFIVPGAGIPAFSARNEAKRQAVNAWIRTSGEYDDVVDFDQALRDPDHPTRILPTLDSGDHAHPNDEGYEKMSRAVHLRPLREE